MKKLIRTLVQKTGYDIVRFAPGVSEPGPDAFPPDFEARDIEIVRRVTPFTMTSAERILSLVKAVEYVVKNDIPGDIVECGVWKGGSAMAALLAMMALGKQDRDVHLFDTFEGMTQPTERDLSFRGESARELLEQKEKDEEESIWAYSPLEKVRRNVLSLGYDPERIHFVKGMVEETIPLRAPGRISLLRLDTDWYESTYHELTHLYPRLSPGGVLIVDDYGHWQGAKRATDDYIEQNRLPLFLSRIDYTGRIAIKR